MSGIKLFILNTYYKNMNKSDLDQLLLTITQEKKTVCTYTVYNSISLNLMSLWF